MKAVLTVEFVHVKGHDTLTLFSSRETVLNHWCDGRAKAVVARIPIGTFQRNLYFPAARVAISCDGTIGRSLTAWLCGAIARSDLLHYLQDKYKWDQNTVACIDWDAYAGAHQRLLSCQKSTMVKYRSRWLTTRARLHLLQSSPTTLCPLCGKEEEIIDHLLTCSKQHNKRQQFYRRLKEWFRHFRVPLKLHRILLSHLKFALGDFQSSVSCNSSASTGLQKFCAEQEKIGWGNLLCGFASASLAVYMDEHLPEKSNCDGLEWVIRLLCLC